MLAVEMLQAFLQMNVKVAPGVVVIEGVAGAAGFVTASNSTILRLR